MLILQLGTFDIQWNCNESMTIITGNAISEKKQK